MLVIWTEVTRCHPPMFFRWIMALTVWKGLCSIRIVWRCNSLLAHGIHVCHTRMGMNWRCLCRWKGTEIPLLKRYTSWPKLVITIRSLRHKYASISKFCRHWSNKINCSLSINWSTRNEGCCISNSLNWCVYCHLGQLITIGRHEVLWRWRLITQWQRRWRNRQRNRRKRWVLGWQRWWCRLRRWSRW